MSTPITEINDFCKKPYQWRQDNTWNSQNIGYWLWSYTMALMISTKEQKMVTEFLHFVYEATFHGPPEGFQCGGCALFSTFHSPPEVF